MIMQKQSVITDTNFKAFTEKHYALLLLDAGLLNDAETLLYKSLKLPILKMLKLT